MPKTGTENTIHWVVSHATRKGVHFIYILNEVRNDFFSLKHINSNLFSHEFSYKANTVCIFTKESNFNGWVEKNWSSYPKIMTKSRVICETFKKTGLKQSFGCISNTFNNMNLSRMQQFYARTTCPNLAVPILLC